MPKKKNIVKLAKEQLINKRKSLILELDALYKLKNESPEDDTKILIDQKIFEISQIDDDLSRKDKKSSRVEWVDNEYVPPQRGNGARSATIVNNEEYREFRDRKYQFDSGPQALWLKPGILVKTKGRDIPGIVLDVRNQYASVLFGGMEIDVRKLALRPADWED